LRDLRRQPRGVRARGQRGTVDRGWLTICAGPYPRLRLR
jgi:hypothetical protein